LHSCRSRNAHTAATALYVRSARNAKQNAIDAQPDARTAALRRRPRATPSAWIAPARHAIEPSMTARSPVPERLLAFRQVRRNHGFVLSLEPASSQ